MALLQALMEALGTGLKIWEIHLENKYYEQWKFLTTQLKEEQSKPRDTIDQSVVDNIEYKLLQLAQKFTAEIKSNEKSKLH